MGKADEACNVNVALITIFEVFSWLFFKKLSLAGVAKYESAVL